MRGLTGASRSLAGSATCFATHPVADLPDGTSQAVWRTIRMAMLSRTSAYSPIRLLVDPGLGPKLTELARGRAVVIDYFASRRCGATLGDLTAAFGSPELGTDYVELEPVDGIPVVAERHLLSLLAGGATLRLGGPVFARHLAVSIEHPERWLEFLEHHPGSRH